MARSTKKGLTYTFLPIDFFSDLKIKKLVKRTGQKCAPLVYQALLLTIYSEGYYIVYDEDLAFIIGEQIGLEEDDVNRIIETCLDLDLLSKQMFESHGILTSHGIQKYYNEACENAHRSHRVKEYSLLEDDMENDGENSENDAFLTTLSTKSCKKPPKSCKKCNEENRIEKKRKEISSFSLTPFPLAEDKEDQKKESSQSVLYYLTFEKNIPDPNKEIGKIRDYNNLNGKPWDTMSHEQQMAAARMWQQKPPKPPRYTPAFLGFLKQLYDTLLARYPTNDIVQYLVSDRMREGVLNGNTYTLSVTEKLYELIERDDTALALIKKYIGKRKLNYTLIDST